MTRCFIAHAKDSQYCIVDTHSNISLNIFSPLFKRLEFSDISKIFCHLVILLNLYYNAHLFNFSWVF